MCRVLPQASRRGLSIRAADERENGNCRRGNAGRIRGGDEFRETLRQRARLGGGFSLWDRTQFRAASFGTGETLSNRIGRSSWRLFRKGCGGTGPVRRLRAERAPGNAAQGGAGFAPCLSRSSGAVRLA